MITIQKKQKSCLFFHQIQPKLEYFRPLLTTKMNRINFIFSKNKVSAGYSRRISLSLDSKPDSMLKSNVQSYFNKYASNSNGVLKNSSNSLFNGNKYSSNNILNSTKSHRDTTIIDLIDISNTSTIPNVTKPKAAQKRPNQVNWANENDDRNSIEKFRKVCL